MSGRAESQDIQQQRLVVAFPAVFEKSAFGLPAVRHRCAAVLRPWPVGAAIERVGKGADFLFVGRIRVKIDARRQRTGQQKSAVHRRQFALPGAPAGPHIEKMIIKALIAGGIGSGPCGLFQKKRSVVKVRSTAAARGMNPRSTATGYAAKREAGGGNAGGPIRRGLVEHQSVVRIRLMQKVAE